MAKKIFSACRVTRTVLNLYISYYLFQFSQKLWGGDTIIIPILQMRKPSQKYLAQCHHKWQIQTLNPSKSNDKVYILTTSRLPEHEVHKNIRKIL